MAHFFEAARFFLLVFFFGTLAPSLRASERPIAIACFLLVTFFPERPDFKVPAFRSFIARPTLAPAFLPYFFALAFFFAAMTFSLLMRHLEVPSSDKQCLSLTTARAAGRHMRRRASLAIEERVLHRVGHMARLSDLACRDDSGAFRVVVEAPRGSHVKLKYEPADDIFVYSRALAPGLTYPYDWGFVPGTTADDGDPLDAMVIGLEPTWPGVVIPARPIGMVLLSQLPFGPRRRSRRERNDRVIFVPTGDARASSIRRVARSVVEELEAFFVAASKLPRDRVTVEGWTGVRAARQAILRAERRYRVSRAPGGAAKPSHAS